MDFFDQLQRKINLTHTPTRIISLVPSQTELLVDMGLSDYIVGVTKFCVHPPSLKQTKTIVGGTKNIKVDVLKALKPDIILCNKEENTQAIVLQCEAISVVHVSNIFSIADCIEMIIQYGELFNKKVEARKIAKKIQDNLFDFKAYIKNKPCIKVAYFIWRNPWMVAGNHTFINYLLELNKFENVFSDKERYPEVQLEQLPQTIEVVLLSSEPYPFKKEHVLEINNHIPATKVSFVDGEFFSWYGSRLLKAFAYFKTLRENV